SPSISINTETLATNVEPLNSIDPSRFVENTADSEDSPSDKDDILLIDSFVADILKNQKVSEPPKVDGKRKQVVYDSAMNQRTHELMSALVKARSTCDTIRERDRKKDKGSRLKSCMAIIDGLLWKRRSRSIMNKRLLCFAPK
nr:hypothetical protein [Tanacetum cinerariifolium]